MTDAEYYYRLLKHGCEDCYAYNEIGHCGTAILSCEVPKLEEFVIEELQWDIDYFLDYVYFWDEYFPQMYSDLESEIEEYESNLECPFDFECY